MRLVGLLIIQFFAALPAVSATLNFNSDGRLTDASGVEVGNKVYSVEFQDGLCTTVFSGCNEIADFGISDADMALLAGKALLDQVLIGNVDNNPSLQFGCDGVSSDCVTLIPYSPFVTLTSGVIVSDMVRVVNFGTSVPSTVLDIAYDSNFRANETTTTGVFSDYTFAKFNQTGTISPVPVPAGGTLLLSGLLAGFLGRRLFAPKF